MSLFSKRLSKDILSCRVRLGDLHPRDAGGKGWNLLRLYQGGYPVPPFCLVSSRVFVEALRPVRRKIEGLIEAVDVNDRDAADQAAAEIRNLILGLAISPAFRRELEASLDRSFGDGVQLAVRSSVVDEDSSDHSFAGQMDSFLGVARTDTLEAVKKVWASAFSARALLYRKRKNITLKGIASAVVIQEMVGSAASGVLFTRDPETREPECLVSAGFGLGDGVVLNTVDTDTYRLRWDEKDGLRKEVISTQVLTDGEIRRLCALGVRAERDFGRPQDIEWALDARGRIFVLQTRPVIFAPASAPDGTVRVWDNSNIVESYPGLTLPLTFSFVRGCYEIVFRDVARSFDLFGRGLAKREDIFPHMIGLLGGRVYYNLLNWYEILSYLPGFDTHKASWDRMIGISQKVPFPKKKGSARDKAASFLILLAKLLMVRRTLRRFFLHFGKSYDKFGEKDFSGSSAVEVVNTYAALKEEFAGKWYLTLHNDICAMSYYEMLRRICARRGSGPHPNLHNDLLCGVKGIESAAPVRALVRLAEVFRGQPLYRRLIAEKDDEALWRKIQCAPALVELKNGFDDYLRRYGDRGTEELKLETVTYREEPALLLGLVRNYYNLGLTVESLEANETKVRGRAEDIVQRALRNPVRRVVFRFVLGQARRAIAGRENMRFARTRLFGIVRRLSRRAGALFEADGLIDASSDIYYLTLDEVLDTVRGTYAVRNLKALIALRKAEYVEFGRLDPKERFVTRGIPGLRELAAEPGRNDPKNRLQGISCSAGVAEGAARVVRNPRSAPSDGRFILVAKSTDPGWVFLIVASQGIVVERGSVLSHTAIIGRELGIPTIVGVKDATRLIPDGASLFMDGSTGEVRWQ